MNLGLCAIAAGIAVGLGALSSIGEGMICAKAIEGMARNPEMQGKLQTVMIMAVALDESTAIYALIVAMLIMFVLGGQAYEVDSAKNAVEAVVASAQALL